MYGEESGHGSVVACSIEHILDVLINVRFLALCLLVKIPSFTL